MDKYWLEGAQARQEIQPIERYHGGIYTVGKTEQDHQSDMSEFAIANDMISIHDSLVYSKM